MKTGQQGFSLVEVMVAILILGVALAGLTHGITTALASSKDSELQATAALFAAGKIETLRAEQDVENGETDGDGGAGFQTVLLPLIDLGLVDGDVHAVGVHFAGPAKALVGGGLSHHARNGGGQEAEKRRKS